MSASVKAAAATVRLTALSVAVARTVWSNALTSSAILAKMRAVMFATARRTTSARVNPVVNR
jgi:hypothetical protein